MARTTSCPGRRRQQEAAILPHFYIPSSLDKLGMTDGFGPNLGVKNIIPLFSVRGLGIMMNHE
jgi:hypothetical protein